MTTYDVTLAQHELRIDADQILRDAHWVTFTATETPSPDPAPIYCESCAEATGARRPRPAPRTYTVAVFPANQIRRIIAVIPTTD